MKKKKLKKYIYCIAASETSHEFVALKYVIGSLFQITNGQLTVS